MKTQNCDEANRSTRIGAVDQAASIIGADRQHRRWFALSGRAHRSGCGVGWQATGAMTDLLLVAAGWRGCAMPRYMVGGYDDYSVLHLVPVSGNHGVELPAELYQRWRQARAELDAAQRDVVAHLRRVGGPEAVPEELRESGDHSGTSRTAPWDSR
jgi:DNA-binding transcriptional LysR family regulator